MRKILTIALMAVSVAMMAQHVTPVEVTVAELNLDSLRDAYISQPEMYQSALKVVERNLEQNAADLKKARLQQKAEQAHVKEMGVTLKESQKLITGLKKTFAQEEKELKAMLNTISKQQTNLLKQTDLNQETRDNYTRFLEEQQKGINYSLRDVADRMRTITDLEEALRKSQNVINAYHHETIQKGVDITSLETKYKHNMAKLKKEQKAAKSIQ